MSKLSKRSKLKLEGVHPDLVRVVERAAEIGPEFIVTEGMRSLERQRELRRLGKSQTLASRHLTGHAVDLADLKAKYCIADMNKIAGAMKAASTELGVPICWGGDWKRFKDTPHFELDRKVYPAGESPVTWKDRAKDAIEIAGSARAVGGLAVGGTTVVAAENAQVRQVATEAVRTVPAPSASWLDSLTNLELWQTLGERVWALKDFAVGSPVLAGGLLLSLLAVWLWPAKQQVEEG